MNSGLFFKPISLTYERAFFFFDERHRSKIQKAGNYWEDMAAFHVVCECCFNAPVEREAEGQLVVFALMVHITYF